MGRSLLPELLVTYILTSAGQSFDVFSNAVGELWLIVGIDSSYEGRTDIFIIRIEATFSG